MVLRLTTLGHAAKSARFCALLAVACSWATVVAIGQDYVEVSADIDAITYNSADTNDATNVKHEP